MGQAQFSIAVCCERTLQWLQAPQALQATWLQKVLHLQTWEGGQSAAEALRNRRRKVRCVGTVSSKLRAPQTTSSMHRISRLLYVLSVM